MYDTAVGSYAFANCPAFDVAFPTKVGDEYHTVLVSIKCWDGMSYSDMKAALDAMKDYVAGYREEDDQDTTVLCILLVVGCRSAANVPDPSGSFPSKDAYVTVVVPENDRFSLNAAVIKSVTASQRAEMLQSHPFAHVEDHKYNPVRATTSAEDWRFAMDMLEDKTWSFKSDDVVSEN